MGICKSGVTAALSQCRRIIAYSMRRLNPASSRINPLTVFLPKRKLWLFVFARDGESITGRGGQKPKFKKEVARGIAEALDAAIRQYRAEHDPRANLEL